MHFPIRRVLSGRHRLLILGVGLAMTLFLGLYAWAASLEPYWPAFDDPEHVFAASQWSAEHRLTTAGPFLRVPLWQIVLGTAFSAFGQRRGLFLLQASIALGAFVCYVTFAGKVRGGEPAGHRPVGLLFPLLLFATSPQIVLYARQAVNEPLIGLLVMLVMALGVSRFRGRSFLLGAVCGAAALTKVVGVVLAIPALGYVLQGRSASLPRPDSWARRAWALVPFTLGICMLALPLFTLHHIQRRTPVIDTTAAYNLSRFDADEWYGLGDHMARYEAGMEDWRENFLGAPVPYLKAFLWRLGSWIATPSSTDFALFYDDYPDGLVRIWDQAVFFTLLGLAAIGTDRRHVPVWSFPIAVALACTFGPHVPRTPKISLIYPAVLLAPLGLQELLALRRHGASRPPGVAKIVSSLARLTDHKVIGRRR